MEPESGEAFVSYSAVTRSRFAPEIAMALEAKAAGVPMDGFLWPKLKPGYRYLRQEAEDGSGIIIRWKKED